MEFLDKVALVTGAGGGGSGQGKAIALAFALEGADVVVNDIDPAKAEAVAQEIRKMGRRSIGIKADIANEAEVNAMMARAVEELDGVDILVNNAGFGYPLLVEDMATEVWRRTIGVNLDGVFYCSRAVIPMMKRAGWGRIINIASPAGKSMSVNGCAAYTSASAGVMGFTRHLAFELGPYKITVNSICPGTVISSDRMPSPEAMQKVKESSLLGDIPATQDMANAVLFLASNKAWMITGTNLDAYAIAPGNKEYWDNFVKRRKDFLARLRESK